MYIINYNFLMSIYKNLFLKYLKLCIVMIFLINRDYLYINMGILGFCMGEIK